MNTLKLFKVFTNKVQFDNGLFMNKVKFKNGLFITACNDDVV